MAELNATRQESIAHIKDRKIGVHARVQASGVIKGVFADEKLRGVLAQEGIESPEKLLASEAYAEMKEVKALRELRASSGEKRAEEVARAAKRRETRSNALALAVGDEPDVAKRFTHEQIVNSLSRIIRTLDSERQALFLQTPEGQEALRAEIMAGVKQRHKVSSHELLNVLSERRINFLPSTVVEGDITASNKYGEEPVKAALRSHFGQAVDAELAKMAKTNKDLQLGVVLDTVKSLPQRWKEIRATLQGVQTAKEQTVARLSQLLTEDNNGPLSRYINGYDNWGRVKDVADLASRFVDSHSSRLKIGYGMGHADEPTEAVLGNTILEQERLSTVAPGESLDKLFFKTDGIARQTTILENPQRIAVILAQQAQFYRDFQTALADSPANVAEKMSKRDAFSREIAVKSPTELGLDKELEMGQAALNLKPLYEFHNWKLSDVEKRVSEAQRNADAIASGIKKQIVAKVEMNWADAEFKILLDGPQKAAIVEARRIISIKEIADKVLPDWDSAVAELREHMDEMVLITDSGRRIQLEFETPSRQDPSFSEDKAQAELRQIEQRIQQIDRRMPRARDGVWGFFSEKQELATEKSNLEKQQKVVELKLKELEAERVKNRKLEKLLGVIIDARWKNLDIALPLNKAVPLRVLTERIRGQMNFQLTPEQSKTYSKYQELEEKRKRAGDQYAMLLH